MSYYNKYLKKIYNNCVFSKLNIENKSIILYKLQPVYKKLWLQYLLNIWSLLHVFIDHW
jgi:hypothetical protein